MTTLNLRFIKNDDIKVPHGIVSSKDNTFVGVLNRNGLIQFNFLNQDQKFHLSNFCLENNIKFKSNRFEFNIEYKRDCSIKIEELPNKYFFNEIFNDKDN